MGICPAHDVVAVWAKKSDDWWLCVKTGRHLPMADGKKTIRADVTVVGGGLSGLVFALAVSAAGLDTVIIERRSRPMIDPGLRSGSKTGHRPAMESVMERAAERTKGAATELTKGAIKGPTNGPPKGAANAPRSAIQKDDRAQKSDPGMTTAVGRAARAMLSRLGVWDDLAHRAPIHSIRIEDIVSDRHLDFDRSETDGRCFGHIVINRQLIDALYRHCDRHRACRIVAPASIERIERGDAFAHVYTKGGDAIQTRLVVGADGRDSWVRKSAGIGISQRDYHQKAFVFTIRHQYPHAGRAWECFFPGGPLAVLPMADDAHGRHRSAVVWTMAAHLADRLVDDGTARAVFADRWGARLGALAIIEDAPRAVPLSLVRAHSNIAPRLALIGDAIHALHPVAGQGINLGWRDGAVLASVVIKAARRGDDIGGAAVLGAYDECRRPDITAMSAATDIVNRLYSHSHPVFRMARQIAFSAMSRSSVLRRLSMSYAMGLLPGMPPLLHDMASADDFSALSSTPL